MWFEKNLQHCLEIEDFLLANIGNLVAYVNKGNKSFLSYLVIIIATFSQPKNAITDHMLLNLKSNIKANILWPFFLSNACKKELKGIKTSKIYYFM
jgi:hypothetical protein